MLSNIEWIRQRNPGGQPAHFDAVVSDEEHRNQYSLILTATELLTYPKFCNAVLSQLGKMFGNEQFEGRNGPAAWRSEVDQQLNAKQGAKK